MLERPVNFNIRALRDWEHLDQSQKQVVKTRWCLVVMSYQESKALCCGPFKEKVLDSQTITFRVCSLESLQYHVYTYPWKSNKKEGLAWVRFSGHLEVAGMSDSKGFLERVQMVAYFIGGWKETQREQLFTIGWRAGSKAAGSKAVAKT